MGSPSFEQPSIICQWEWQRLRRIKIRWDDVHERWDGARRSHRDCLMPVRSVQISWVGENSLQSQRVAHLASSFPSFLVIAVFAPEMS